MFAKPPDSDLWKITANDPWMDTLLTDVMTPMFQDAVEAVLQMVGDAALRAALNEQEVLEYGAHAMGLDLSEE